MSLTAAVISPICWVCSERASRGRLLDTGHNDRFGGLDRDRADRFSGRHGLDRSEDTLRPNRKIMCLDGIDDFELAQHSQFDLGVRSLAVDDARSPLRHPVRDWRVDPRQLHAQLPISKGFHQLGVTFHVGALHKDVLVGSGADFGCGESRSIDADDIRRQHAA